MGNVELVSIIIPVYNVAPYLAEALDSAIYQTYENLEIILVDDGSTDGSGEICDEYAEEDNRVRVIHQKNRGLSAARNAGLDVMNGSAVAFLDSDDAYHPDYVRAMLKAMNSLETDIVICRFTIHNTTDRMEPNASDIHYPEVRCGIYDRNSALRILVDGKINPGVWNIMYRRELWKEVRFPVGRVYENVDTIYRLFDLSWKSVVLDQSLYMYRRRPGAITGVVSERYISDWVIARTNFENYIRDNIPSAYTEEDLARFLQVSDRANDKLLYAISSNTDSTKEFIKELRYKIIRTGKA